MINEVRLMTWNVNGLRASMQRLKKKSLKEFLDDLGADIMCFQETKTTRSELDEDLARPPGYDAFYSFSRMRSGYSGVVTFCRSGVVPTVAAEEGLTGMWKVDDAVGHIGDKHLELSPKVLTELESEGRCVITDHQAFVLINVYCPASRNSERIEYKMAFHELLFDRICALQRAGKQVIVVGDINIAHRELDHCDPEPHGDGEFGDHPCRQWMDRLIGTSSTPASVAHQKEGNNNNEEEANKLVDAFRHFHPTQAKAYTFWSMVTAARQTNYGVRLDYILVDKELMDQSVTSCSIQPDQLGSDHCPVVCNIIVQFDLPENGTTNTATTAALCAKNFVEFAGKQQSLKTYFTQQHQQQQDTHAIGQNPHNETTTTTKESRPNGSSQRSIKSFFTQPKPKASLVDALAPTAPLVVETVETTAAKPVDDSVWRSFLGAKRHFEEQEQTKWKQVLSGQPPKTPICHCGQPTVLRTVLKANENWGRKFYVCTRPAGEKGHPDARCEFFQWVEQKGTKKTKR